MTEEGKKDEENRPIPSQAECQALVKFARCVSLTADRLAGSLIEMTTRLEDEGFLKTNRPSRIERDKKIRSLGLEVQKSDDEIKDMMKLISGHPDAEKLVNSLFKDAKGMTILHQSRSGKDILENNVNVNANNDDIQEIHHPGELPNINNVDTTDIHTYINNEMKKDMKNDLNPLVETNV